jgi:hypothetical protein
MATDFGANEFTDTSAAVLGTGNISPVRQTLREVERPRQNVQQTLREVECHSQPVHRKDIEFVLPEMSRLDGMQNYQIWSFRIQRILERNNVWNYCIEPPFRPSNRSRTAGT